MDDSDYGQNLSVQFCFPENNASCRKEVRSGPAFILLFIFLSCVSVCTVFLNLLVIISISHFKQLHTPTNLLILSLAAADLLVGMFVMPVKIMKISESCWYFGDTACSVFELIIYSSMTISLSNMVLIAVDRFIAVSDPLLYSTRVTVWKTGLLIILSWSFSLSYNIIVFYSNDHLLQSQITTKCYGECVLFVKYSWVIIDLVICFLTPCCVILVLYSIIFSAARRQAKAVRAVMNASGRNGSASSSETKAAKTLGLVIFIYIACWIPYYVSSLTVENVATSSTVVTVFLWLIYLNSSMNPLIYAIFYPWFRASVKVIVSCRIIESFFQGLVCSQGILNFTFVSFDKVRLCTSHCPQCHI